VYNDSSISIQDNRLACFVNVSLAENREAAARARRLETRSAANGDSSGGEDTTVMPMTVSGSALGARLHAVFASRPPAHHVYARRQTEYTNRDAQAWADLALVIVNVHTAQQLYRVKFGE
jgi:hypothetical protein